MGRHKITRRVFLRFAAVGGAGMVMAACGGAPEAPQPADTNADNASGAADVNANANANMADANTNANAAAPAADAPTAAATPTREVPRGQAADVPRNQSLVLANGDAGDIGIGNPYAAGFNHQRGMVAMLEPLYFYSAFAKETIPWLADGDPQYNSDSTEVTIKTRKGAEWSDGTPFTAKDVAFTLNMLRDEKNAALTYAKDMNIWVKNAEATDDNTVKITFNKTAPRFVFDFLAWKFDLGVFIVPEHIFKDVDDVANFLFYDPSKGWPISTGPYKVVDWTIQQRLLDVRPDWWAAKTSFAAVPAIKRVVVVPFTDATNAAQQVISNELDSALDFRPPVIKTIVEQNPKVTTHTGREAPYGYTDWWPQSLFFNCEVAPFNDPDIRRAINHAINREQVVEIGYEGAGLPSYLPFPNFPSLETYLKPAQDLLQKYPTNAYDLAKVDEIMTSKGFTKDGEGLWVGSDGKRLDATIYGIANLQDDYGAVLAEQIRQAGFDCSYQAPPDSTDRMANGSAKMFLFGFAAAIADIYPSMDLMHSRRVSPTGTVGEVNARWKNEEYDKIVDQMSLLPVSDPKGVQPFLQALEIYLKELPHVPIVQWQHRIALNQTYWSNWPTQDNPYVNGCFWHKTFPLMLHKMQPA